MSRDRRTEIAHHLTEAELDEQLRAATDEHRLRRLAFVKNLYRGDTLAEAADRVGRSGPTGSRWAAAWNEGGLEALLPDFGGGRPPKLDAGERARLLELLREGQPWRSRAVGDLIAAEFGVEYHPDYLDELLRNLGLTYADLRSRPGGPGAVPDGPDGGPDGDGDAPERRGDAGWGWIVDDR